MAARRTPPAVSNPEWRNEIDADAAIWLSGSDDCWVEIFDDGCWPPRNTTGADPDASCFKTKAERRSEIWGHYGAALVAEHIAAHPGTRPPRWWSYKAPLLGVARHAGESEADCLSRTKQLSATERHALKK